MPFVIATQVMVNFSFLTNSINDISIREGLSGLNYETPGGGSKVGNNFSVCAQICNLYLHRLHEGPTGDDKFWMGSSQ